MSDQPANITLRLALDRTAILESQAGIASLSKDMLAFKGATQDAGDSGDKAASTIGQAMTDVSTNAADATKQVNDLNSALAATAQTADQVSKASSGIGGGGVTGLRRTGSALTQLGLGDIGQPVQKIGDLGQVIKEVGVLGDAAGIQLEGVTVAFGGLELTLSPLLLVIAAVGLAVLDLKMILDLVKKSTDDAVAAQKAAFDQEQAQIKQEQDNRAAAQTTSSSQNKQNAETAFKSAQDYTDAIAKKQAEIAKNDQSYNSRGAFDFAGRNQDAAVGQELKTELNTLEEAQNKFFETSKNASTVLAPMIKTVEDGKKATDDLIKSSDDLIKTRQQETQDNNLTSKSAQDKLDALKADAAATTAARDALVKSGDTSDAVTAKIADYNASLKDNAAEQDYLTKTALPLIQAREDEAQKIKDTTKALADQAKAGDDYEKAVTAVNDQRKKSADDIQKIEDDSNQARADLEQSYADKRVDIARKAVETAQDELTKLEQKQADLTTGLNRNLESDTVAAQNKIQDLQTNFARQQVSDTQDHLQKLQDIQRQAQQSDQDALLNRNFRQLFENKQQTSNAIDAENERYQTQEQQRITALNQQETDEATSAARQRQQRLVAYNQAEADAQLAYQRQVEQQDVTEQRQLQDAAIANQRSEDALVTKANRELAIQQQSAKDQLALLEQTELDKLTILQNAQNATKTVTNGQSAGGTGPIQNVTPYAAGGRISAFQAAVVNEPGSSGNESFNGAQFPRSMGLFIPSQAGNINSGKSGNAGAQIGEVTIHIHEANNPAATEAAVYRALKKVVA